jgi:hypothetical protein
VKHRDFWVSLKNEIVENYHSVTLSAQVYEVHSVKCIRDSFKIRNLGISYQSDQIPRKYRSHRVYRHYSFFFIRWGLSYIPDAKNITKHNLVLKISYLQKLIDSDLF